jgi:hypothetical protein
MRRRPDARVEDPRRTAQLAAGHERLGNREPGHRKRLVLQRERVRLFDVCLPPRPRAPARLPRGLGRVRVGRLPHGLPQRVVLRRPFARLPGRYCGGAGLPAQKLGPLRRDRAHLPLARPRRSWPRARGGVQPGAGTPQGDHYIRANS